jgi:hypothetical protein
VGNHRVATASSSFGLSSVPNWVGRHVNRLRDWYTVFAMIKNVIIFIFAAMLVWFGTTIVRLENYYFASQMGYCQEYKIPLESRARNKCLNEKQTRTNPIWHLLHGLRIV